MYISFTVCLIETKRKNGCYLNPYNFKRRYEVDEVEVQQQQPSSNSALEEKLSQIQRQLELVTAQLNQRGKSSQPKDNVQSNTDNNPNILTRLRSSFAGPSTSHADDGSEVSEEEAPPNYSEAVNLGGVKKKTIYVRKIDLLLNGAPLDQLGDDQFFI